MNHHLIASRTVKAECQERGLISTVCGLVMLIVALILGARGIYSLCAIASVLAAGFVGAAMMALRIERKFTD